MATLKHIASKNSDYSAIEAYLIYQHDAFTGKQLLDEQGRPMLRDSYILDTLECGTCVSQSWKCANALTCTRSTYWKHKATVFLNGNTGRGGVDRNGLTKPTHD